MTPKPMTFEECVVLWANALLTFSDNREAAADDLRAAHAREIAEAEARVEAILWRRFANILEHADIERRGVESLRPQIDAYALAAEKRAGGGE